jgi:abhydrolase domain-containing protein 6
VAEANTGQCPIRAERGGLMVVPSRYEVSVGGHASRVLEHGSGAPVVFLAGFGGLPAWPPFLEALASTRRVMTPSLPGFPGSEAFRHLDELLDWIIATVELLEALELEEFDLIGSSVAGALAADAAALMGTRIRRLVLIAPFGSYDDEQPAADLWAQPPAPDTLPKLLCSHPEKLMSLWELPEGEDPVEWQIVRTRATEAAARFLFPLGNTGVLKRLHRITAPTLLLRGTDDRVIPESYLHRFAESLGGPVERESIVGAGHLAEIDAPEEVARIVNAFLSSQEAR